MNIVVCVKEVPDSWAEKKLKADFTEDRESVDSVMNELDEYGVEEALRLKEAHGGEVTVVTMGPSGSTTTIRKALSMGADKAVHLTDEGLAGSDAIATSLALSKVIAGLEYDLIIVGSESTDARLSIIAPLLAERLGVPQLSQARKVTVDGSTVTIERQTETGYDVVSASTPALVGVVEKINEPRYPSFKGIMAAKSKPLSVLSIADAGIDAGSVGLGGSSTSVADFTNRPPRTSGQIVKDEGDGGAKVADFLASQKFV